MVNHVPLQPDTLHVVFNPRAYTIRYQKQSGGSFAKIVDKSVKGEGKPDGIFHPKVDGKRLCYTLDDATKTMTVEEMGEQLIKALVPKLATG